MYHPRKPTSVNEKVDRVPSASPIVQELQESTPKVCCRTACEHDSFLSRNCFVQFHNIDRRPAKFHLIIGSGKEWTSRDPPRCHEMSL